MARLDELLGALLAGSYANSVLYTLEALAVIQYYRSASKKQNRDTLLLQAIVYWAFIADTVCTVSTYIIVYLYTITHWGDVKYIQRQHVSGTVMVISTGISAATVQCFLIYRYWRISRNKYITFILVVILFAALGGYVGTIVSLFIYTAYAQRPKLMLFVTIWSGTGAALDVAIALVLIWQLSRIKSPFNNTQSLIHKLMASTIGTGAVTSVVAVAILITFVVNSQNNVSTGMVFCLGRIYTLTMLYNLNNRSSLNRQSGNSNSGTTGNTMNGINVIGSDSDTLHLEPLISHVV